MSEHIDNLKIKVEIHVSQQNSYGQERLLAWSARTHGGTMKTDSIGSAVEAMADTVKGAVLTQLNLSDALRKSNSQVVVDDVRQGS